MVPVEIKINELGPIRDSVIEIKPLVLLTGESGLGKSYCAFAIHYLFDLLVSNRIDKFFKDKNFDIDTKWKNRKAGEPFLIIPKNDLLDWMRNDCIDYIRYLLGLEHLSGDIEFEIPYPNENFIFTFSEEIQGLENQEELFIKIFLDHYVFNLLTPNSNQFSILPLQALIKATLIHYIFGDNKTLQREYIFPPSRGSLMELSERPSFGAGMYHKFFDFKADCAKPLTETNPSLDNIEKLLSDLNDGRIDQIDNKYTLTLSNGQLIPLSGVASSVKELLPFTLFLKKFPVKGSCILFEEPEAHLHPSRQIKLADLIARFINGGGFMQITSHGDYFLTRFNILIKLYSIFKQTKDHQLIKDLLMKVNTSLETLLSPASVAAYVLKRNEECCSKVEKLDIVENNEIALASFYSVIENQLQLDAELREIEERLKNELDIIAKEDGIF